MKNTFFLIFLMVFSLHADAQVGGIFKRKTKQKAKQERNKEIDKALDKTAAGIRGIFKKNKDEPETDTAESSSEPAENGEKPGEKKSSDEKKAPAFDLGSLFGGGEVPDVADEYVFDYAITWKIESGKDQKETAYIQYFPEEGMFLSSSVMGYESIIDFDRNVSVTLMNETANVMKLNLNAENTDVQIHHSRDSINFKFEKTGREKNLAGYVVEEFTFDSDDSEGEIWATDQLKFNRASIFGAMKNNPHIFGISESDTPGMVLEIKTRDKKNDESMHMYATEVKEEKRTIDLSKYKKVSLGNLGNY